MNELPDNEWAMWSQYLFETMDRFLAVAEGLDETQLDWRPAAPAANSVAVLVTHTLGNIREGILVVLAGQPNRRDRDAEFTVRGTSGADLQAHWQALRAELAAALASQTEADLTRLVDHPRRGRITGRALLIHTIRHAAEHLGQAELTRDLGRAAM